MATGIQITTDDLRTSASNIDSIKTALESDFSNIKSTMTNLNESWKSPGASAIEDKFTNFAPEFAAILDALGKYSQFLKDTAVSYESNEQDTTNRVNSNVEAFK